MYTNGKVHGTDTDSTIKMNVDNFYKDKLINYSSKIDVMVGYCNDRSMLSYNSTAGIGQEVTYYKAYVRVETSTPILLCENVNDLFTTSTSSNGNKALTYPIGLITIDEVMLAGHAGGIVNGNYSNGKPNLNYYLSSSKEFWTMTPAGYYIPYFQVLQSKCFSTENGHKSIDDTDTRISLGNKPVINIRSDVTITGSGTMSDPYVVN